jgi:hypothetical protein
MPYFGFVYDQLTAELRKRAALRRIDVVLMIPRKKQTGHGEKPDAADLIAREC